MKRLIEGDRVVAGVMAGHDPPETVGLLLRGLVHRVLEELGLQVADAVPVENHVHVQFRTPADRLVQELDVFGRGPLPPGDRVDGDADQVPAHFLDLHEMPLAPVPLHLKLVGIGDRQSAENDRFPVGIDELVSFDRDPRQLLGAGGERPLAGSGIPPPV